MLCISRMHSGSSTQFSTNLQLYKVIYLVYSLGLLAELPAILDSFFTNTTSDYIGVVGWGWWGATKWRGKTHVK